MSIDDTTPDARRDPFLGDRPALIGHRGAPAYRPEHTADGYRLAIAQGADFVEPDVVPSRDGVLVIRHEPLLDQTTDVGRFAQFADLRTTYALGEWRAEGVFTNDLDWEELQLLRAVEPLPDLRPESARHDGLGRLLRLRDLVDLLEAERGAGRACGMVIELKHPDAFAAIGLDLVELLQRELGGRWDSPALEGLMIESFERDALRRLREAGTPAALVALVDATGGPADEPGTTYADELTAAGLDELARWASGISVSDRQLGVRDDSSALDPAGGRALVDAAHERGLRLATYTLRPEDRFVPDAFAGRPEDYWRGLLRTGVDAVFADAPDRARAVIDEFASRPKSR